MQWRTRMLERPATRMGIAGVAVVVTVVSALWLLRPVPPPPEESMPVARAGAPPGATTDAGSPEILVHVTGAVARPGVYQLAPASRVTDAVEAAGGLRRDAYIDRLNLAAPLVDGSQVHVPGDVTTSGPPVSGAAGSASSPGPIALNSADVTALETLPGIGPALAAAIVADRERNGLFASVDDLARVRGIGPARVEALRDLVVV